MANIRNIAKAIEETRGMLAEESAQNFVESVASYVERERKKYLNLEQKKEFRRNKTVSKRVQIQDRLAKLIPTLEYDVLYNSSTLASKIGYGYKRVLPSELLTKELDLAVIELNGVSSYPRIMRIGEQKQDLPILFEPVDIPEKSSDFYLKCWRRLASAVSVKGYATHLDTDQGVFEYNLNLARGIFRDFIRENELPTAVPESYARGIRTPMIVYHPTFLRMARDHKK
ncbi:Uncharacterised protein [uncultured archaeon]|nr:Uncharacterised protein [uncultured archaeon]